MISRKLTKKRNSQTYCICSSIWALGGVESFPYHWSYFFSGLRGALFHGFLLFMLGES